MMIDNNRKEVRFWRFIIRFFLLIILLIIVLFLFRIFLPRQIDDVNPNRLCEDDFIDKSETLMIIPIFEDISIAENKSWCSFILSLNKTLGMHGVYHSYNEFSFERDEEYIKKGMEEFKKCFGFYPVVFEAPQLALLGENEKLLKEMGFEVRGYPFNIFHKVYHCIDFEKNSYLIGQNRWIDWF